MEVVIFSMILICFVNYLFEIVKKRLGLKTDKSFLFCGISAFCGSVPANPEMIKMIMLYNEERGEDGTGWAVNNEIKKDTEKVKKFIQQNKLVISEQDENYTIIAHARKSSSGTKFNKELAHPFGVYKDEVEGEKYDLILAMNGTLSNTKQLADKWDVEYKVNTNSDTQILSRIMVKLGVKEYIKAIQSYDGTATLVFFTPSKSNTLMVYKDPEKPLFHWNKSEEEMYISSMEEPLVAVGADKNDICTFEDEFLYTIIKGRIEGKIKIVRTPLKPKVEFNASVRNMNSTFDRRQSHYEWADFHEGCKQTSVLIKDSTVNKMSLLKQVESSESHKNKGNGRIYTVNEKYYRNGHPIHGMFYVNSMGKIKSKVEAESNKDIRTLFFVNGFLCKSNDDYDIIISKCSDTSGRWNLNKFKGVPNSQFIEHYMYPALTIVNNEEKWVVSEEYASKFRSKGESFEFTPFLSDKTFKLKYYGKWIATTKKFVCETEQVSRGNYECPEDIDDVTSESNIVESKNFIIKKIMSEDSNYPNFYYADLRKDLWKRNPNQTLREHFFSLLISLAEDKKSINSKSAKDLMEEGKKTMYGGKDFLQEIEKLISSLREKLVKNGSLDGISTENKVRICNLNPTLFTEKEVLDSIEKANVFYSTTTFQNSFLDCEYLSLDSFASEWVTDKSQKELYNFYEGILLCLGFAEKITVNELLYVLAETDVANIKDMVEKAENLYNEWVIQCSSKGIKDDDKENEKDNEDVEDLSITNEILDANYYESEFYSEYGETIGGMKDLFSRIEKTDKDLKSEKLEVLEMNLKDMLNFLKKHVTKST